MSVNLCAQEGEEPRDVVLHFDVRFHRDNIISLSRKNGVWIGSGNYDTNYNMFVPGTVFRIVFEVKDTDVITIYCQGKFHSNFLPKIPLSMARFLVAWADVERITHCFFHMGAKPPPCAGDEKHPPVSPRHSPQRSTVATAIPQEYRRCYRTRRKTSSPEADSSNVSSDEKERRPKAEGRADRFFYDSLMCPTPECQNRIGSPNVMKFRRDPSAIRRDGSCSRMRPEHSRKYTTRPVESDTEKNYSDGYTDETVVSKDSTIVDSDSPHLSLKKFTRRGSRNPFTQVASFMGKTTRKNI